MKHELQDQLYKECPRFFQGFVSGVGGYYGICIRDEWFDSFREFCHAVEDINDEIDNPIIAERVKEKFFDLRVYTNYSTSSKLFSKDVIFTDDIKKKYADAYEKLIAATESR